MDRGKQGLKRSTAAGVPLAVVSARANRHDVPLREPTLAEAAQQVGVLPAHLDSGYDGQRCRDVLAGEITTKGVPTPVQSAGGGRSSAPSRR